MLPENRIPTHPGEILQDQFLERMRLTQVALAAHVGVPVQRIKQDRPRQPRRDARVGMAPRPSVRHSAEVLDQPADEPRPGSEPARPNGIAPKEHWVSGNPRPPRSESAPAQEDNVDFLDQAVDFDIDSQLQHTQKKIQRIIDLVRLGLATVKEPTGVTRLAFPGRPFELTMGLWQASTGAALVEEFQAWLLGHGFQELIESVQTQLDWAASFCYSLRLISEKGMPSRPDEIRGYVGAVDEYWRKFHKMPLTQKLENMRSNYGVVTDLEEAVISIHRVRNCLTHRGGVVDGEVDCNVPGALAAVWIGAVIERNAGDGPVSIENQEDLGRGGLYMIGSDVRRKSFEPNARVRLDSRDFNEVAITCYVYCRETTKGSVGFVQRCPGLPLQIAGLSEEWLRQTAMHLYLNLPEGDPGRSQAVVVDWQDRRLRPCGTRSMVQSVASEPAGAFDGSASGDRSVRSERE